MNGSTQLNESQIAVLQDLFARDPSFRSSIQQRFNAEAVAAEQRASHLKAAAESLGTETATPPAAPAKTRGRPKGAPVASGSKMEAVVRYIAANPDCTSSQIAEGLKKSGVEMGDGMLNTYLYQLNKRNDIEYKGDRGSRVYRVKGKKPATK